MSTYRMEFDASVQGDGSMPVVWTKTLEELLVPNGSVSLLEYMLSETDKRGGKFVLERVPS